MKSRSIVNYIVATVVTAISFLPIIAINEVGGILARYFILVVGAYYLFTFHGSLGDWIIYRLVLRANVIQNNAVILPIISSYCSSKTGAASNRVYINQCEKPYLILISKSKVVVSIGADGYIADHPNILQQCFPEQAFRYSHILSQRLVLLSLSLVPLARVYVDGFMWILERVTAIILGIAIGAASGELGDCIFAPNSFAWGRLLSTLLVKAMKLTGWIQDKLIELVLAITQVGALSYIEESNTI